MPERHLSHTSKKIKKNNKHISRSNVLRVASVAVIGAVLIIAETIQISPFHAFGGVVWAKNGVHYISEEQVANRIKTLNAPKEAVEAKYISTNTQSCDSIDSGFCLRSTDEYAVKSLVTPEVSYKPATPDTKVVTGYCTLCRDGSWSPSCAVGRGACSWHGGPEAYNVAQYRTIPGTPAVQALPADYSYTPKSYSDSDLYKKPENPNLAEIVNE